MNAPKIFGHDMQEMHTHHDYVRWETNFNSGSKEYCLSFTVIKDSNLIYSIVHIGNEKVFTSPYFDNEQGAADKAVDYLNHVSNLLKNLKFGL